MTKEKKITFLDVISYAFYIKKSETLGENTSDTAAKKTYRKADPQEQAKFLKETHSPAGVKLIKALGQSSLK